MKIAVFSSLQGSVFFAEVKEGSVDYIPISKHTDFDGKNLISSLLGLFLVLR